MGIKAKAKADLLDVIRNADARANMIARAK